jgi:hypothetical protein
VVFLLAACLDPLEGDATIFDVVVAVDPTLATVLHVSWSTQGLATGSVVVVGGTVERTITGAAPTAEHAVTVLGLPPDADVDLQIVSVAVDGGEEATVRIGAHTDPWGPQVPVLALSGQVTSWVGSFLALNTVTGHTALVLDSDGSVVWAREIETGADETLMRVVLTADGKALLALVAAHPPQSLQSNRLVKIQLDGSGEETIPWPNLDHDVVELPDGRLAGIVKQLRGESWGDAIVEREADGTFRAVYSTWDDPVLPLPQGEPDGELTHANALDFDSETDAYYLNLFSQDMLVRVDRETGTPAWHLYGPGGEFRGVETDPLGRSHQFQLLGNGHFLHFENADGSNTGSRVREFAIDESALTYAEVWRYEPDPALSVYVKGDVERYDDGGTGVLWATSGRVEDIDRDGTSVWRAELGLGDAFTYHQHVDRFGP